MAYKVLEQNGVDNENVDGGAFNRFTAGMEDCIVKGVFSECALTAAGNGISISTGLMIVCGVRIKIFNPETLFLTGTPVHAVKYQIIVQAVFESNRNISVTFFLQSAKALRQDNIYNTETGVYQAEVGSFVHNPDGSITELQRTMDVVAGSTGAIKSLTVGKTVTLPAGSDAMVENVGTEKEMILNFSIPRGKDGNNLYAFSVQNGDLIIESAIADESKFKLVNGDLIFGD